MALWEAGVPGGIYPPVPTFFTRDEELDVVTLRRHIRRLADSGIAGYVLMGSNGEAVHLTEDERLQVLEETRDVLDGLRKQMPLIVGCGAQSTRQTIELCLQAAWHGADFVLILPPAYYPGRMDERTLHNHYRAVADASPVPVLIYNMPNSAAGINLKADFICSLAQHPNIVGVKDSAGDVAKLMQIVAQVSSDFRVFAGSADVILPALIGGAVGAVAALANVFPQAVCRVQTLVEQGLLEEARLLQGRLIPANTAVTTRFGVAGLKMALEHTAGYGGLPRQPLLPLTAPEQHSLLEIITTVPAEV
ncbi:dihydrodipicolinate synthase family protein [Dictyobacter arantiisoli]|uniref:Dihydrodipicolinate synthase family protein n=1 Tax=Dictyobacter arantiisoli TaxID=2014874 RepID=A0A5A5TB05_9CHLR|nr:dihydrodipicolinate synthase family protein [Dictyobacter arantiisoli]GCF08537.1 dihydrodipicolinate synthase family protein [Dictyobacter arantiisoli]